MLMSIVIIRALKLFSGVINIRIISGSSIFDNGSHFPGYSDVEYFGFTFGRCENSIIDTKDSVIFLLRTLVSLTGNLT